MEWPFKSSERSLKTNALLVLLSDPSAGAVFVSGLGFGAPVSAELLWCDLTDIMCEYEPRSVWYRKPK